MQYSTIFSLASLLAVTLAAPAALTPRTDVPVATIQFNGADPVNGAFYTEKVPLDGSTLTITNKLSISTIVTEFAGLESCTIVYADLPAALSKIAEHTWAIGPPQFIKSISCPAPASGERGDHVRV